VNQGVVIAILYIYGNPYNPYIYIYVIYVKSNLLWAGENPGEYMGYNCYIRGRQNCHIVLSIAIQYPYEPRNAERYKKDPYNLTQAGTRRRRRHAERHLYIRKRQTQNGRENPGSSAI